MLPVSQQLIFKKSLKIRNLESEAINRRTDNTCTMAKRKRTNNDLQNTTWKIKRSSNINPGGELRCSGRINSSCSTSDTCRVILVTIKTNYFLSRMFNGNLRSIQLFIMSTIQINCIK